MLTIICALAENHAIGYNNQLLYHLRADLQRFKALTTGHTIIMGRKTYESLPKGALPNRRNIVLTRQTLSIPGAETFASLQEALEACQTDEDIYIIGGESVYAEAFPIADRLCLTHIHATPENADAFFPQFNTDEWTVTANETHPADEKNDQAYTFTDYIRK